MRFWQKKRPYYAVLTNFGPFLLSSSNIGKLSSNFSNFKKNKKKHTQKNLKKKYKKRRRKKEEEKNQQIQNILKKK